jgi:hypothetical protein
MLKATDAKRIAAGVTCLLTGAVLCGCADLNNLLDPSFLGALGFSSRAASLPGDAPAVVVAIDNRTARTIEVRITWRDDDNRVGERLRVLPPDTNVAEAVICPVTELTLGDVSDLNQPGAFVRLGSGGSDDPFIEVEPFGVLLKEDANYSCGDEVTFTVQASSATLSGYQIFAFIRRAEAP